MMIYICTPTVSKDRDLAEVRKRVEDLTLRLRKRGYDACSHLDSEAGGKWADRVGGNIALILASDGILLDDGRRNCRVCIIEESVARLITSWRSYIFLHTSEEYRRIADNFVV